MSFFLKLNINQPKLKIIASSDFVFPFCYIGYHRIEKLKEEYNFKILQKTLKELRMYGINGGSTFNIEERLEEFFKEMLPL